MYKVYVKTKGDIITAINSDAFIDSTGWAQIDEGEGDRYHHAQGNYLPKPIMTMQGIYQYKLVDGKVVERTAKEIASDIAKIPPPPPSPEERLAKLEKALNAHASDIAKLKAGKVDKGPS
jgi:hypothetical protein